MVFGTRRDTLITSISLGLLKIPVVFVLPIGRLSFLFRFWLLARLALGSHGVQFRFNFFRVPLLDNVRGGLDSLGISHLASQFPFLSDPVGLLRRQFFLRLVSFLHFGISDRTRSSFGSGWLLLRDFGHRDPFGILNILGIALHFCLLLLVPVGLIS